MFYYTYKITNLINEKIYIGVHKTENLEDGYMGSGKVLNRAKDKHGIENFHKEILKFHESQEEMFAHEAELVTQDFLGRNDVYNIKLGGEGGWDHIHNNAEILSHINKSRRAKFQKLLDTNPEIKSRYCSNLSIALNRPESKLKQSASLKLRWATYGASWTGKKHSEESKAKVRESLAKINHQQGEKNSQFGKMWIHSLEERKSKRINNNEPIPTGWKKGRKMFKN